MAEEKNQLICVAGASGLVGSQLVKLALEKGYRVNGTLRNKDDETAAPYLKALPGADTRLTLFSAEMANPGTFDEPMKGANGVFIATLIPLYAGPSGVKAVDMDDAQGWKEIINPTKDGCINILESARKAGVKTAVICSSTSSTNPVPPPAIKNEVDHWSDADQQISVKKYTSAAKTVMEKAALDFCEKNDIRVSIFLPTLMLGPVVLPKHLDVGVNKLFKSFVAGEPPKRERISPGSISMIHMEDFATLLLTAYETPNGSGRYFGVKASWTWVDIYAELKRLVPSGQVPKPLEEGQKPEEATQFDMTRQDSLGVKVRDIPEILKAVVEVYQN